MKLFKPALLLLPVLLLALMLGRGLWKSHRRAPVKASGATEVKDWQPPDITTLPHTPEGESIRYGRDLIAATARYLGPKGSVAAITNGMACQNCHPDAGTRLGGNAFAAVAANYPRYRDRSGIVESIEFRINDCLLRSLNGKPLDSLSREMRAMVSYIKWLGQGVKKGEKPADVVASPLPYLPRAADSAKGRVVYQKTCSLCHGPEGAGLKNPDSVTYMYPPLWGRNSYNTGAGLYRLSHLAAYVKSNMPYGTTYAKPVLRNEEAWDVAAFIVSQPRPHFAAAGDWPDLSKKPVDYPFGPYTDSFTEQQHQYGPFEPIKKAKERQESQRRQISQMGQK